MYENFKNNISYSYLYNYILAILAVGVIIYITSPRCKKYKILIDEKDENNDNNKNKDSKIYRVVKIINNLIKSDKKIE